MTAKLCRVRMRAATEEKQGADTSGFGDEAQMHPSRLCAPCPCNGPEMGGHCKGLCDNVRWSSPPSNLILDARELYGVWEAIW